MAQAGQFDPDLTQLIVDEETYEEIGHVLDRLIKDSQATAVTVLDRAGQIIAWQGASYGEERVQLGALIAGTFSSTREVARILRENAFKSFLQEGAKEKIFTESVGDQWLVSVIFGKQAHLGLVKVLCSRSSIELNHVLQRTYERSRHHPRLRDIGVQIVANDTIDLLFRDDAEPQWTEE
jgi:predicted regulator of Ras-like GTPase activity (Roadblock/LC7/MglB family)